MLAAGGALVGVGAALLLGFAAWVLRDPAAHHCYGCARRMNRWRFLGTYLAGRLLPRGPTGRLQPQGPTGRFRLPGRTRGTRGRRGQNPDFFKHLDNEAKGKEMSRYQK